MRQIQAKIFVSILLLIMTTWLQAENPWNLSKEEDGIQVYVRNTSGSAVKSFKGSMTVKTSLSSLVAVFDDAPSYPRWLHNCKSARTLKDVSDHEAYNYVVTAMPWPVANRDTIIHSQLTQNKSSKQVQVKLLAEPNYLKPKRGIVRIKTMVGRWVLTPVSKGKINVVYEMSVDPGGNIPKWLVNAMAVDLPFYTLQKIRKIVREAKYANAKRPDILE